MTPEGERMGLHQERDEYDNIIVCDANGVVVYRPYGDEQQAAADGFMQGVEYERARMAVR